MDRAYSCEKFCRVICLDIVLLSMLFVSPAFSQKGKPTPTSANPVLVYHDEGNFYVSDGDGRNRTLVYSNIENNAASWCSKDGTDIIFQDEIGGQSGIWRLRVVQVDADSGKRTVQVGTPQLVAKTGYYNPYLFSVPRCSPNPINGKIKVVYNAYAVDNAGNLLSYDNLYIANVDSTTDLSPVKILSGDATGVRPRLTFGSPSWSSDGNRIGFKSTPWDGADPDDVELIDIDWSAGDPAVSVRRSLVLGVASSPLQGGWDFFFPRWSNKSDQIAVGAVPQSGSGHQIWLIPADTPENAKVVNYFPSADDVRRLGPSWSPNDDRLIYQRIPRIGMCFAGDGNRRTNSAIAVSNLNDSSGNVVAINGCDEVAIVPVTSGTWKWPDWWRGAQQ